MKKREERGEAVRQQMLFSGAARIRLAGLVATDLLTAANRLVDLVSMDRYFLGSIHAQSHLVTPNLNHDNRNIVIDDNALVLLSREY